MKRYILIQIIGLASVLNVSAQEWQTDFDKAIQIANDKEQKVILVFSGSDWCAPCMKLEKEIWQSEFFKQYSEKHFVLLRADFPRKKENKLSKQQEEKNKILAEKYDPQGFFPFVVVLDKDKNVLGTTGNVKASPSEYVKILESF